MQNLEEIKNMSLKEKFDRLQDHDESGLNICLAVKNSGIGRMTINQFLRVVARVYNEEEKNN